MRCPSCGGETSPQSQWCQVCGAKLNLTKAELDQYLKATIKSEQKGSTEVRVRRMLAFAVFLFILTLAAFVLTREKPHARTDVGYPWGNGELENAEGYSEESLFDSGVKLEAWERNEIITLDKKDLWAEPMLIVPTEGD